MIVSAIVAVSENNVIGHNGDLPWHLPKDMRFFKETTMGHHVIIGRKNWESIPDKYRPLPGRSNLIVTRQTDLRVPGVEVCNSLEEALQSAKNAGDEEPFIIGGGQIYRLAFEKNLIDRLYLTRIHSTIEGEILFPDLDLDAWVLQTQTFHPSDEKHAHAFSIQLWEK
jgi:dihydrofolate reductase